MPTREYTLPNGKIKYNRNHGRVSGKGSFPALWLDAQNQKSLDDWGITVVTLPDPLPPTQDELDEIEEAETQRRLGDMTKSDLITILTEMVNVERENRSNPVPRITDQQFKQNARALLRL